MLTMATSVINGKKNPALEEYVKQRLGIVMRKFEGRINSLEVRFKEEPHKKALENICTIEVTLNPRGKVRVSSKKDSLRAAALNAIHRAELQVSRDLKRHQRGQNLRHRKEGLRQETRQWAAALAASA